MMTLESKMRIRSPWIMHFDTGSCNGCDMEVWALLTPRYDIERFGAMNRANPKQADILLITGPVTKRCEDRLRNLYEQTPEPKLVIACGDCASTGAPFHNCYNVNGGVDKVIPVDVYVPGCACRPEVLIDALVLGLSKWREKAAGADKEAEG
jgi:ech hydrogenase subunit C